VRLSIELPLGEHIVVEDHSFEQAGMSNVALTCVETARAAGLRTTVLWLTPNEARALAAHLEAVA
jgi:hypothetical protein